MTARKIVTNVGRDGEGRSFTASFDFGDNLGEMSNLFSPEIIYQHALDNMVISYQAKVRGMMKGTDKRAPATDKEIEAVMKDWKPTIGRTVDPAKKIADMKAMIARLTPEQLAELGIVLPTPPAPKPTLVKGKGRKAA
jgi:hypothetical protein